MGEGLELSFELAMSLQEVKDYVEEGRFTHLFISEAEYVPAKEYFDSMYNDLKEIIALLTASIKTSKQNEQQNKL